jgi:segregation and condensation protein B
MTAATDLDHLKRVIESILFVADDPVDISALARIIGRREADVTDAVDAMASESRERGVRIQQTAGAVQMVTAPEAAPFVEQFLGVDEDQRISHAALETLAIIAYKQPITRGTIEAIRGVNCDRAIASLKARGLITEVGRAPSSGRPYLYGTTFRFLEHFGLERPEDLPPLPVTPEEPGTRGTGNREQVEAKTEEANGTGQDSNE